VKVEAKLTYASRSTMEIQVRVTAEDVKSAKEWEALMAYFVFVALDPDGATTAYRPHRIRTTTISSR
jgi:acyl-CoA hydrolase